MPTSNDIAAVIVDSGGANLASLQYALRRLGASTIVTQDPSVIAQASHVILPGVGAAAMAMQRLQRAGLIEVLRARTGPLLGICLGMQLLFEYSAEGNTPCLGLLPGRVEALAPAISRPVPHMGWNTLGPSSHPLLKDCSEHWFYFVHGFYASGSSSSCIATTEYGVSIAAAVAQGPIMGVQCHPERSAAAGARLLNNFLNLHWPPTAEQKGL